MCVRGGCLYTEGDDGECYTHGETRPRQAGARVSVCVFGVSVLYTQGDDGERYTHGETRPRQGVARVSVCVFGVSVYRHKVTMVNAIPMEKLDHVKEWLE